MRRVFFLFFCFAGYGIAQGCGGSDVTIPDGSDDGTVADGPGTDSGGQDVAQNDTGTTEAGGGDGSTGEGGSSDGGITDAGSNTLLRCGDASVNDCSQCQGATQPCVYCNFLDASVLTGVCTPLHQNCFNTIPQGFQDCVCQSPSACPEAYQVCSTSGGGRCHTCSDNNNNTSLKCENGGTCNAVDGGCL